MNFRRFLAILRGRWLLAIGVLVVVCSAAIMLTLTTPKGYRTNVEVMVEYHAPVQGVSSSSTVMPSYMQTQVDLIGSKLVAYRVIEDLKLIAHPDMQQTFKESTGGKGSMREWLAGNLREQLHVQPGKDSRIITISYEAKDPSFAAAVADSFARAYIATSLSLATSHAQTATRWYDNHLGELRARVAVAQQRLAQYQTRQEVLTADPQDDVVRAQLSVLLSQLAAAENEARAAESRQNSFAKAVHEGTAIGSLIDGVSTEYLQALKIALHQAEGKLAAMERSFGTSHPAYERAKIDVAQDKAALLREQEAIGQRLFRATEAARERVGALRLATEQQKGLALREQDRRNDMPALMRELEKAQLAYDTALQRRGEAEMQGAATHTNLTILNPAAVLSEPSTPNVMFNMIVSVLLGVTLALIVTLTAEMITPQVRTVDDIGSALGMLPLVLPARSRLGEFKERVWQRYVSKPGRKQVTFG